MVYIASHQCSELTESSGAPGSRTTPASESDAVCSTAAPAAHVTTEGATPAHETGEVWPSKNIFHLGVFLRPTPKTGPANKKTVTKRAAYSIRLHSAFINFIKDYHQAIKADICSHSLNPAPHARVRVGRHVFHSRSRSPRDHGGCDACARNRRGVAFTRYCDDQYCRVNPGGRAACARNRRGMLALAFTRYCFTSRLMCMNRSSFIAPPPSALPALLHYYCTTIAQFTNHHRPPVCMPYTIN